MTSAPLASGLGPVGGCHAAAAGGAAEPGLRQRAEAQRSHAAAGESGAEGHRWFYQDTQECLRHVFCFLRWLQCSFFFLGGVFLMGVPF